ncbi:MULTISPECIES: ATP-binding protein [Pseudofrankia]|uniref:ATP-binding protein n=1 Tax=Pseudofrankia TaxID=2994363 RepID=UPI0009F41A61|nr:MULTISPECIES: ATP-binding protein [Pseudofrankia]
MPRVLGPARGRADTFSAGTSARRQPVAGPNRTVLLTALLVIAVAALCAIAMTPSSARASVSVAVLVGLAAAAVTVVLAIRQAAGTARLADRVAALDAQAERRAAELTQLADDTLPKIVAQLRDGISAQEALAGGGPAPSDAAEQRILRTLAEEVGRGERMRAAAMAACANAAGRVQALATSMLADLRDMEDRHSEEVLGDLLRLDHSVSQAGRLADSIAVLTGARSGRRWTKPIVMESILRGALGRISAYQRVRLHSTCTAAVAGYAAEGVMHALAELMDNATSFSPPSEEVHVYVEEVQAGIVVTIEDGGLVMGPAALRRAERAVSAEALDLTTLSGTRLGLAVVGSLARKYGLTVSFRPSSRGGTGVIVIVPRQLITQPRPEGTPLPGAHAPAAAGQAGAGQSGRQPAAAQPSEPAALPARAAARQPGEPDPLPKRGRGETLAGSARTVAALTAPPDGPPADEASRPTAATTSPGARFGAFQQAGARARSADTGPAGTAGQPPAQDTGTADPATDPAR